MNTGKTFDKEYKELFTCGCPRPKKGVLRECLMVKWHSFITELSESDIDVSKIITGEKENRVFHKEEAEKVINEIESKVKKVLRRSEKGIEFIKKWKTLSHKFPTFCVVGCQKISSEYYLRNLTLRVAKLLNLAFLYFYLENQVDISNAHLQDFELRIERRELGIIQKGEVTNDYLENWEEFSQEPELIDVEIVEEGSLFAVEEQLDLFNIENYFLEGDLDLTKTLIDLCPKNERRGITCDIFDETYWLAARKIIHLFIHENEKFKNIDLSADCLVEQKADVTELRRLMELVLRKRRHGNSRERRGISSFFALSVT